MPGLSLGYGVGALPGLNGTLGRNGTVAVNGTFRLYAMGRANSMISFSSRLRPNGMISLHASIGLNGTVLPLGVDVISGLTRATAGRPSTGGALRLLPRELMVLFRPFGTLRPDGSLDALPDLLRQHGCRRC